MSESTITCLATARIPTQHGDFELGCYGNALDGKNHLSFHIGDITAGENVIVRVHSECLTGDVFGSLRCDCGEQLDQALQFIAAEGSGMLIYLRQEGRGIGLLQKMHAYNLQDEGHDTVDANLILGHGADEREYSVAAGILESFDIKSIRLITNNPAKISALESEGIQVNERIEINSSVNPENSRYLTTKAERMNHLLHASNLAVLANESDSHESQSTD
ncbi:MAG: GTP cyclohydrolase II [Gammaproteobacteria bacterium]|nr:GTP cyclohydrolase II [Gammaproteobacteria bacterium]MDD9959119.1 GTP cyclohydrolase II [Gammaproteobacteria bacterium]